MKITNHNLSNITEFCNTTCPVCNYSISLPFCNLGDQVQSTFSAKSEQQALSMKKLPHDFVFCPKCSHVWNKQFDYSQVPYETNSYTMYNSGVLWENHLSNIKDKLISYLPKNPTIIDIGCADGHFIKAIANYYQANNKQGRFIGFDPNSDDCNSNKVYCNSEGGGKNLEFYSKIFDPIMHSKVYSPDAFIMRHLLEHLTNPAAFLESFAYSIFKDFPNKKSCYLLAEVPCIDKVFENPRLTDFFYAHISHFTTKSFYSLMQRAGKILELFHSYNGEVLCALIKLDINTDKYDFENNIITANNFYLKTQENQKNVINDLYKLKEQNKKIAFWGSASRGANFINIFKINKDEFPLVVDSDKRKEGLFVPGTAQQIRHCDYLKTHSVDVIVITTQWRAKDILFTIKEKNISYEKILIEHNGQLIDFENTENPYR